MLGTQRPVTGDLTSDIVLLRLMVVAMLAGAVLFVVVAVTSGDLAPSAPTAINAVTEVLPGAERDRQVAPAIARGESRGSDGA